MGSGGSRSAAATNPAIQRCGSANTQHATAARTTGAVRSAADASEGESATHPAQAPMAIETRNQRGGCTRRASIIACFYARQWRKRTKGGLFEPVVEIDGQIQKRSNQCDDQRRKYHQRYFGPRRMFGHHAGIDHSEPLAPGSG